MNNIPDNIKELHLGYYYNIKLSNLPNLTKLVLSHEFNQPLDELPLSLKILVLGVKFSQPLDNLPNELDELILSNHYNESIDNIPDSITYLYIGIFFKQPIKRLPQKLNRLSIYFGYKYLDDLQNLTNISNIKLEIY